MEVYVLFDENTPEKCAGLPWGGVVGIDGRVVGVAMPFVVGGDGVVGALLTLREITGGTVIGWNVSLQFIRGSSFVWSGLKANEHFLSHFRDAMLKSVTMAVRW